MAKTGRPMKATARKEAAGTLRVDRLNPDEPVPIGKLGPAPEKLDAVAATKWNELTQSAWWLTDADRNIAELYCREWSLYEQSWVDLERFGQVWERENDHYTQLNGARQTYDRCIKNLDELGRRMGLDPVARTAIAAPQKPSQGGNRYALD